MNGKVTIINVFAYKCEAVWPETFLSGSVQLTVAVGYDDKAAYQMNLAENFIIEGISTKGQSVIDFLTALDLDTALRSEVWDCLNDEALETDGLNTLNQLMPVQYKIKELLEKIHQLQEIYLGFAHKDEVDGLIKTNPTIEEQLFKNHKGVILKDNSPVIKGIQYLSHWDFPKNFEKNFLTPLTLKLETLNKKIRAIHKEQALAEQNYIEAKTSLEVKSPIAATLLTHVYSITNIDKVFQTLKANYPEIIPPDGTDAFRLVVKEKEFIDRTMATLNQISTQYKEVSAAFVATYKELYKGNGVLKDKILNTEAVNFKKAAKKAKQDVPANLILRVFGKPKEFKLHAFLFDAIGALVKQANDFYDTFDEEFKRIQKDFAVIDTSTAENAIRAYTPVDDVTGDFHAGNDSTSTTYKHKVLDGDQLVDEQGINPEDVDQGALGDCYFLSSVASLAQFAPETIYGGEDAIIQGPDDKGLYTVKLYIPDGKNGTKRVSIQVNPTFLTKTVVNDNSKDIKKETTKRVFAQTNEQVEIWPLLLEKALAQLEGAYSEITGNKNQIYLVGSEILTGKKAKHYKINEGIDAPIKALIELYHNTGKIPMAQFGTQLYLKQIEAETKTEKELPKPTSGEAYILYKDRIRLYANHLYYLKGISSSTEGAESFLLQNPHNDTDGWLKNHGGAEITIDRTDLENYFQNIIITA